ncbi:hypothetical protein [Tanticharoenia sakaeratensis]|jgi:hypothetical protein|uniref:Lipoprotein n=1 Tax=Tanticharoenia sakaeratensis NBRC 103193 TaxID=1231623 RepID=A0A0D6MIY3_9PROT|nr:hypothetical protein [Tanticharoenia sakaeratensis]GAN53592.1 hypothetical protein Tasa_010_139 [Tanticharoenia sakaeratensis NBRC 103193]GBQ17452.1 hypothetical protein AA103193_0348 [Tanticharoenia sakaeratensis NBRC 103193]
MPLFLDSSRVRTTGRAARAVATVASMLALAGCVGTAAPGPVPPGTPVTGLGYTCKAGIYTCKMPYKVPLGASCSCPGLGAASYGNVHLP